MVHIPSPATESGLLGPGIDAGGVPAFTPPPEALPQTELPEITQALFAEANTRLRELAELRNFDDPEETSVFNAQAELLLGKFGIDGQTRPDLLDSMIESRGQETSLNPFVSEVLQGGSFNFSDEITGQIFGPQAQAAQRAQSDVFGETNPAAALTGQVLGGIATPLPIGKLAPTKALISRSGPLGLKATGTGAAIGAGGGLIEGIIAGLGSGRGPLKDRIPNIVEGGVGGTILGAGIGAGSGILRRIIGGRGAQAIAEDEVLGELGERNLDVDQVEGLMGELTAKTGAEATIADINPGLQRQGMTIASARTAGSERSIERLRERDLGEGARLTRLIEKTFNKGDRFQFDKEKVILNAAAKKNSAPLYAAALPAPVPWSLTLQNVLNKKRVKDLIRKDADAFHRNRTGQTQNIYQKIYDSRGRFRTSPTGQPPNLNIEDIHAVQQAIRGGAESQAAKNKGSLASELRRLRRELMGEANAASPINPDTGRSAYKDATNIWRSDTEMQAAADKGLKALRKRPGEIELELAGMTAGERQLYQLGTLEDLLGRVGKRGDTKSAAIGLKLDTKDMRDKVRLILGDADDFQELVDGYKGALQQRKSLDNLIGGSSTAANTEELVAIRGRLGGQELPVATALDMTNVLSSGGEFVRRRVGQFLASVVGSQSAARRQAEGLDILNDILYGTERAANQRTLKALRARNLRNRINQPVEALLKRAPVGVAASEDARRRAVPEFLDPFIP